MTRRVGLSVKVWLGGVAAWCLLMAPSQATENPDDRAGVPYVAPATVRAWLDEGQALTFLDVREPDEFAAGHLPDAITIVYDQVEAIADQLPHDRPIVVYCIHSAHRAPEAAKTLRRLGFSNAYVLEGGIVAWQAGGLTILASDRAKTPTVLPKTERCSAAARP